MRPALWKPLGDVPEDRHALSELDHERPYVEDEEPTLRAHRGRVVVEDGHELLLRGDDRAHPQVLYPRILEQPLYSAVRELAQRSGEHWRETLLVLGQSLTERGLDVDPREQLSTTLNPICWRTSSSSIIFVAVSSTVGVSSAW